MKANEKQLNFEKWNEKVLNTQIYVSQLIQILN